MCLRFCRRKPHPSNATPKAQNDWARDHSEAEEAVQPVVANEPVVQPPVTETPTGSPPRVEQQPQIPAVPRSLPSQVDETLAECPR